MQATQTTVGITKQSHYQTQIIGFGALAYVIDNSVGSTLRCYHYVKTEHPWINYAYCPLISGQYPINRPTNDSH